MTKVPLQQPGQVAVAARSQGAAALQEELLRLQCEHARLVVEKERGQSRTSEILRLRARLRSATTTLNLLAKGSFALGGFGLAALLAALFSGQLTLIPGLSVTFGSLFIGVTGLVFHVRAEHLQASEA